MISEVIEVNDKVKHKVTGKTGVVLATCGQELKVLFQCVCDDGFIVDRYEKWCHVDMLQKIR
jgi:hypothetical protein